MLRSLTGRCLLLTCCRGVTRLNTFSEALVGFIQSTQALYAATVPFDLSYLVSRCVNRAQNVPLIIKPGSASCPEQVLY